MEFTGKSLLLLGRTLIQDPELSEALSILDGNKCEEFLDVPTTIIRLQSALRDNEQFDFIILDLLNEQGTGFDVVLFMAKEFIPMPILIYSDYLKQNDKLINRFWNSPILTVDFLEKASPSFLIVRTIRAILAEHTAKIELPFVKKKLVEALDLIELTRKQLKASEEQLTVARQETTTARKEGASARDEAKKAHLETDEVKQLITSIQTKAEAKKLEVDAELQGYRLHSIWNQVQAYTSQFMSRYQWLMFMLFGAFVTFLIAIFTYYAELLKVKPL